MYQDLKYIPNIASVVITCHNDSRYIGECISSLIGQTTVPLEIILCDNSTDIDAAHHIHEIAEKAAEKTYDYKLIYSRNKTGVGNANNYGIQCSRGEYLFLANDDIKMISNNWGERMIYALKAKPDGGVFGVVGTSTYRTQNVGSQYDAEKYQHDIRPSPTVSGILVLIPRNVLSKVGFYDENMPDYCWLDVDWAIRVRAFGYQPYFCKDVYVHHLRVASSIIRHAQQNQFAAKYKVAQIKTESDLVHCIPHAKEIYAQT